MLFLTKKILIAQIFNFTTVDTGLTYNGWEGTAYNEDAGYRLFYWGSNANGGAGQDNNTPGYSSPVQIPGTWEKWDGGGGEGITALRYP